MMNKDNLFGYKGTVLLVTTCYILIAKGRFFWLPLAKFLVAKGRFFCNQQPAPHRQA